MTDTHFQEELDMRILSDEALEVLAMRACSCKRGLPALQAYRCLAHRAVDELDRREGRLYG